LVPDGTKFEKQEGNTQSDVTGINFKHNPLWQAGLKTMKNGASKQIFTKKGAKPNKTNKNFTKKWI
jgi:hypothetical protein